jgi:DNA-binding CsgD family transcriptional regulator
MLIAEGHTNQRASDLLGISSKAVEWRRASVMRKLNLSTTAELLRYALRNHWLEP